MKDDTIMELSVSRLQVRNGLPDVELVHPAATPNNGKMGNVFGSEKLENPKMSDTLIITLFSKFIVTIYRIMSWPVFQTIMCRFFNQITNTCLINSLLYTKRVSIYFWIILPSKVQKMGFRTF